MADWDNRLAQIDQAMSLEGGVARNKLGMSIWGVPKTKETDMPYYLPRELVGDIPYRYQGVALHSLLAAIPPVGGLASLGNAGYALGSYLLGRTDPDPTVESQLPPAPTYPKRAPPGLAEILARSEPER